MNVYTFISFNKSESIPKWRLLVHAKNKFEAYRIAESYMFSDMQPVITKIEPINH